MRTREPAHAALDSCLARGRGLDALLAQTYAAPVHPSRPTAPSRPCPACGRPVDPLRAAEVVALETGLRFLCDEACRKHFGEGERPHEEPRQPRRDPTLTELVREATRTTLPGALRAPTAAQPESAEEGLRLPLIASLLAAVLGLAATSLAAAWLSAGATLLASIATLSSSASLRREVGFPAWLGAPLGASLAAAAALWARLDDPTAWLGLAGAGVASLAVVGRVWLDRRARAPVHAVTSSLAERIPRGARVPRRDDDSLALTYDEVRDEFVRSGDEVMALEGEVVTVDGVVRAGDAMVWLHPTAAAPSPRKEGDPVLAGARVESGAIRVLATRVGDERALLRMARFGVDRGRGAAASARFAGRITRWGGLFAFGAALSGLALTGMPGFAGRLAAAAAVLLAAPLLAARRSAELPLEAAAAAAAERGIVFRDALALETAGHLSVVALSARGTVTTGAPTVVAIHPIDGASADASLALAAACEATLTEHPIARALTARAREMKLSLPTVRRVLRKPGRGVTAVGPGGEPVAIGNRQLLLEQGVSVAAAEPEAELEEARGHTALFMAVDGRVRALLSLRDPVRAGARAAIQRVLDLGVEVVLLGGDHRTTLEALASRVDITHVKADLTPVERGAEVARLGDAGGLVGLVGDPARDGAALAEADVPIVLGAAGSPAGDHAVSLTTHDIRDAAAAIWIARAARDGAWRGAIATVGIGGLMVTASALGLLDPTLAALLAVAVDALTLPAGARLLRRVALRIPARG